MDIESATLERRAPDGASAPAGLFGGAPGLSEKTWTRETVAFQLPSYMGVADNLDPEPSLFRVQGPDADNIPAIRVMIGQFLDNVIERKKRASAFKADILKSLFHFIHRHKVAHINFFQKEDEEFDKAAAAKGNMRKSSISRRGEWKKMKKKRRCLKRPSVDVWENSLLGLFEKKLDVLVDQMDVGCWNGARY
jgi:hypothetical protein